VGSDLRSCFLAFVLCVSSFASGAQSELKNVRLIPVDSGWANNSINAVAFRKNSLISYKGIQFIAFYNKSGDVVIGKRTIESAQWTLRKTQYKGQVADAHNSISIMLDGAGYLHLVWGLHNAPLNYCKSEEPFSLELTDKLSMTGSDEDRISYPEFYRLKNGDLLFLYRDGQSGKGKLMINKYEINSGTWLSLHHNLIDGEDQRSAYWQACPDQSGTFHLSWTWRESPNVSSNHDICYACSRDNGVTWEKSTGEKYSLPITSASAEYAWKVPPNCELINQTSMAADQQGNPFIATYWRQQNSTVPQYQLVFKNENRWQHVEFGFRTTPFSLEGVGTKSIPVARPQVLLDESAGKLKIRYVFRDIERNHKPSLLTITDLQQPKWTIEDLAKNSVGAWEATYDTELWREKSILHLFLENVQQADAEGLINSPPQMIYVLELIPD
jgi:BNR repeat-containing family member